MTCINRCIDYIRIYQLLDTTKTDTIELRVVAEVTHTHQPHAFDHETLLVLIASKQQRPKVVEFQSIIVVNVQDLGLNDPVALRRVHDLLEDVRHEAVVDCVELSRKDQSRILPTKEHLEVLFNQISTQGIEFAKVLQSTGSDQRVLPLACKVMDVVQFLHHLGFQVLHLLWVFLHETNHREGDGINRIVEDGFLLRQIHLEDSLTTIASISHKHIAVVRDHQRMHGSRASDSKAFAVIVLVGIQRPVKFDLEPIDLLVLFVETGLTRIVRIQSRVLAQDLAVVVDCVAAAFNEGHQRCHGDILGIDQSALGIRPLHCWNSRFNRAHWGRYINDRHSDSSLVVQSGTLCLNVLRSHSRQASGIHPEVDKRISSVRQILKITQQVKAQSKLLELALRNA